MPEHALPAPGQPEHLLDGLLHYYAQALPRVLADTLLTQLQTEIPWQQDRIRVYGREHALPRLQSWHGDAGCHYSYSGSPLTARPWTHHLQQLRYWLNAQLGTEFNAVLCNLYRDGQDHMGWHSDDEPELGRAPRIASLSFGQERDFALRRRGESRQSGCLPLAHGSLLDMQAGMQALWQHSVPVRKGRPGIRINLTFREMLPQSSSSDTTASSRNIITGTVR